MCSKKGGKIDKISLSFVRPYFYGYEIKNKETWRSPSSFPSAREIFHVEDRLEDLEESEWKGGLKERDGSRNGRQTLWTWVGAIHSKMHARSD